jgi:DNA-binding NarL/FixJ family response regulator
MEKIKLILIEDQTILRETLAEILQKEDDIEIAGVWESAEDIIDILDDINADVAIVDNFLPGMDGITLTKKIRKKRQDLKIILMSIMTREESIFEAFEAGISGYLSKDVSINELVQSIRSVAYGETVISRQISGSFIKYCSDLKKGKKQQNILSDEQKQIIQLAKDGYINKEISERLEMSLSMVKFNFREICRKLGARDRTQAVIKAIEMNLIMMDQE